jgi:hypothetical protein
MLRHPVVVFVVITIASLLLGAQCRADKPTKAEIAKLGKAATAYLDVAGRGTGTAFCIHSSGLFVTNEHVVRGQDTAKVVIDAGLKSQRVLSASVIRVDKEADLALVRVQTKDDLPMISLGSDDGLAELAEVIAFGFPLGAALSADQKEYPAISVNAGAVSALRRKGGDLQHVQVDISVTFGNSGGPVLDDTGRVVGVIVSGIPGQRGVNLAIPVSRVRRFLAAPDIQFTAPELAVGTVNLPTLFQARVASLVPGTKEPTVRLTLQAGEEQPRSFDMVLRDGTHVATATPIPGRTDGRVGVSVDFGAGSVTGAMDDLTLTASGRSIKIGATSKVELKPKPKVELANGSFVEGAIAGLGPAEIRLGDERVVVDLSKATRISVMPRETSGLVTATVIASVDGTEVGRVSRRVVIRGAPITPGTWTPLGGQHPFPAVFTPDERLTGDKNGLRTENKRYVRTVRGDYLTKDFRFEIVYSIPATGNEANHVYVFVGLGAAEPAAPYGEPKDSVFVKIVPPNIDGGWVGVVNSPHGGSLSVGGIPKAGTHRVIIEKKGATLRVAVDRDNDGPSDGDMERTIPDLQTYGPFLTKKNGHLFFGGGATYKEFRISE